MAEIDENCMEASYIKQFKFSLNIVLITFVLFAELKGCGIFKSGGIGSGNFNLLGVIQILSLSILVLTIIVNRKVFFCPYYGSLKWPTILILGLFFIAFLKSSMDCFYFKEITVSEFIGALKRMHIYLLLFFLFSLIKTQDDLRSFLLIILGIGLFSAFVEFYVSIYNKSTGTIILVRGDSIISLWRLYSYTGSFIAMAFFLQLAKVIIGIKLKFMGIIFLLILALGVIVQGHRNVLGAFIITVMTGVIFFIIKQRKNVHLFLFITTTLILTFFTTGIYIYKSENNYIHKLIKTSFDLETSNSGGNLGSRTKILTNTIDYIFKNRLYCGSGFSWHYTSTDEYNAKKFALSPTNDNSITNIMLVFGIPGIICFALLFFQIIRVHFRTFKAESDNYLSPLALGSLLTALYLLITSYFTDNVMGDAGTITFIIIWMIGLVYPKIFIEGSE